MKAHMRAKLVPFFAVLLFAEQGMAQLADWQPPAVQGDEESSAPASSARAEREWLRPDKPLVAATPAEEAGHGWAPAMALLLLVGLAGGAAFLHMSRKKVSPQSPSSIRVVTQTRVGAKASVVALDVGGGVMLLGVTEQHVANLGWLPESGAQKDDPSESAPVLLDPNSRHFSQMLTSALRRPQHDEAAPQGAASILAERTDDLLVGEGIGSRLEAQVAGLSRRRR